MRKRRGANNIFHSLGNAFVKRCDAFHTFSSPEVRAIRFLFSSTYNIVQNEANNQYHVIR